MEFCRLLFLYSLGLWHCSSRCPFTGFRDHLINEAYSKTTLTDRLTLGLSFKGCNSTKLQWRDNFFDHERPVFRVRASTRKAALSHNCPNFGLSLTDGDV